MSWSERIGGLCLALFAAFVIGYWKIPSFHLGVNEFFWAIWVLITSLILFAAFYLLPLAVTSFGVGLLWSQVTAPSSEPVYSGKRNREYTASYKGLIVAIPVTFLIAAFVPGFPQSTPFVKEQVAISPVPQPTPRAHKKAAAVTAENAPAVHTKAHYELEWPWLHNLYESVKTGMGLPSANLEDASNEPYDLFDFSVVIWIGLLVGAPIVGFIQISHDKNVWDQKEADFLDRIAALNRETTTLKNSLKAQVEKTEAFKLRERVEVKKEADFHGIISSLEPVKKGVLDTDLI
jgi:hypothetical protein